MNVNFRTLTSLSTKISYYYYYLYFNAYWASFDVGEKSIPRQNAVYYMAMIKMFLFFGILFGLANDRETHLTYILIAGAALIALLNHFLLSKKIFEAKFNDYSFIEHTPRRRRLTIFFGFFVLSAIFQLACVYVYALQ